MMRFTHRSCTGFNGRPRSLTADTNATTRATALTVSWNCTNLRMLSYTQRPHITALTMLLKLSSIRTMSDASFATSVPHMPMDRPTLAVRSAGASFVPSPVTATISPCCRNLLTRRSLSVGEARASTSSRGSSASNCSSLMARKSSPSSATPSSLRIPHSRAMCDAVLMLSPVHMRTRMPAFLHSSTASGTSARTGSRIPTRPTSTKSCSRSLCFHPSRSSLCTSPYARHNVRKPDAAMSETAVSMAALSSSVMGTMLPSADIIRRQNSSTFSGAPFS
mmetsp:Transcript_8630/g.14645  ORF Transcript_8630/g.14645 Transcript_8630/m.14645 type:complete len:278 (-) Transcript_8630:1160-1993(-)